MSAVRLVRAPHSVLHKGAFESSERRRARRFQAAADAPGPEKSRTSERSVSNSSEPSRDRTLVAEIGLTELSFELSFLGRHTPESEAHAGREHHHQDCDTPIEEHPSGPDRQ